MPSSRLFVLYAAFLVVSGVVPAAAQERDDTATPIDLAKALAIGSERNRQIIQARHDLVGAEASQVLAESPLLPGLTFGAALNNSRTLSANAFSTQVGPQVAVSYDLGTDGSRTASIDGARAQTAAARAEHDRIAQQARLDIVNAFYDMQAAAEQIRISSASVGYARTGLATAQMLLQAKVGTLFDVQRAQGQLANALQEQASAAGQERTASHALARVLGLEASASLAASGSIGEAGEWTRSREASLEIALSRRPELEQQEALLLAAESQVRQALSAKSLKTSLSLTGDIAVPLTGPDTAPTVFDGAYTPGYSGSISLSMPIFDNGASSAGERQAEEALKAARVRLAEAEADLRFRVEQSYNLLDASRQNIETAAAALATAQAGLGSARARFQAGMGSQTEVIDAENDLKRAESNRVRAILDYNRALAGLRALAMEL